MKFSLFIHMERVNPDEDQQQLYEEMMELCRIADEGGCTPSGRASIMR